jgi:tetratricopeptide (TPR) repeat protein
MRKWFLLFTVVASLLIVPFTLAQEQVPVIVAQEIYERALTALQEEDYPTAIQDLSVFILLNPTFGDAYVQRGRAFALLQDYNAALADLSQAAELPQPSTEYTAQVYALRAAVYQEQGEIEQALTDLNTAVDATPLDPALLYQRGQLLLQTDVFAEAVTDFDEVIRLEPNFPDTYYFRAQAHLGAETFESALDDLSAYILLAQDSDPQLVPNQALALRDRALLYAAQDNYPAALADLDQALETVPGAADLHLLRASLHATLENPQAAAADYFEWMRLIRTEVSDEIALLPWQSQVVPMAQGRIYSMVFEAQAGEVVTITARARAGSTVDPLMVIFTVDEQGGAPLLADDDGGGNLDSRVSFTAPTTGFYIAFVSHAGGGSDGPVRVLLIPES